MAMFLLQRAKNPILRRYLMHHKLVLDLGRCNFSTLLVQREHHRDPVPQGNVISRDVESVAAFVRPGRANARPDLLPVLVFAGIPAVIEGACMATVEAIYEHGALRLLQPLLFLPTLLVYLLAVHGRRCFCRSTPLTPGSPGHAGAAACPGP